MDLHALLSAVRKHKALMLDVRDSYQSRDDYSDTQGQAWFS